MSDPILARQRAEAEQARQEIEKAQAAQQDRYRLVKAGNFVEDLGSAFECELKADKEYLTRWVKAMADYKAILAELRMLDRLEGPATGVADLDAWQMAKEIFLASEDTRRAMKMLMELATDPDLGGFAVSVAGCLRRDIRSVAEGWRDKPAVVVTLAKASPEQALESTGTEQTVDLDQIAALVHLKKGSLKPYKRRKEDPLPDPDYPGGGGKRDYWRWGTIRPWLVRNFSLPIPEHMPSWHPPEGSVAKG